MTMLLRPLATLASFVVDHKYYAQEAAEIARLEALSKWRREHPGERDPLSIRVYGLDTMYQLLERAAAWGRGPFNSSGGAALRLKTEFADQASKVFSSQGGSIGKPWPALSPGYARYKSLKWPGRALMIQTGALGRSLWDENDPNFVFQQSDRRLTFSTRVSYAAHHQTGSGMLPARPLYIITRQGAKRFGEILIKDLQDQLKEVQAKAAGSSDPGRVIQL